MRCFCKVESFDLVLEADYGADPLWCKKCGCNLDIDQIPMSQELKDELFNWIKIYSISVHDKSEHIGEVTNNHNRIGMKLLEKLQKELGDRYTVSYKPS